MASNSPRPLALVTGSSSGIGTAYAGRLARLGYDLVLVARREDRLHAVAGQLSAETGAVVQVLAADLADSKGLASVETRLSAGPPVDFLVNNAGFGAYMPFAEIDPDRAEEMIRLQIVAVTRLTRAALPSMLARVSGTIVNVSSILAFSPPLPPAPGSPGRTMYAATKAYVNAFTELLHHELAGKGIRLQALCPGLIITEFHKNMGGPPPIPPMDVELLLDASFIGLERGDIICAPGVEEESMLREFSESQLRVANFARTNQLASRYKKS